MLKSICLIVCCLVVLSCEKETIYNSGCYYSAGQVVLYNDRLYTVLSRLNNQRYLLITLDYAYQFDVSCGQVRSRR